MQRVTHREYLLRVAWREKQLNTQTKLDSYLMRLIGYLDAIWGRRSRLKSDSELGLPLKFTRVVVPIASVPPQQQQAQHRQRSWGAILSKRGKSDGR